MAVEQTHGLSEEEEGIQTPLMLAIDDDQTSLELMRDLLSASYRVVLADNGEDGLQTAKDTVPDLIISDVTMPVMNGFQLCQALKADHRTSHIPVILLTAMIESESRIAGLESGADAYVTKPFIPAELMAQVVNLLTIREQLRECFRTEGALHTGKIVAPSIQARFLQRVSSVIESHLAEEHPSIESLCREIGMSRSQVHRKLVALTGMSLGRFIRHLRLHRARGLLEANAATVSEIAYQVGFSSVTYFSKCFREEFGKLPSRVRNGDPVG